jgi:hypothetical protein
MGKNIRDLLEDWPKSFICDADLAIILNKTDDARYSVVKRALKSGLLICLKKGLYLIASKTKRTLPDEFELALLIYEPSIISLESALSYHNWIPEAVYVTTCVSPKRAKEFKTPIGVFSYKHVPAQGFYVGVDRIVTKTGGTMLVADPWRALADFIYTRRKAWESITDLEADLRIDVDTLINSNKEELNILSNIYPSARVRTELKKISSDISIKS